jgi:OmpA-OmpF porin, OOP family
VTRALLVVAVALATGCAGAALKARTGPLDQQIELARQHGAIRCAPVELAMAESHADFVRQELAEGNYHAARTKLRIAEENARLAVERSPRELCSPAAPEAPGDRDGDGIPDHLDECPDEPEDFDGFQDADGCPDPDNDGDGIADAIDECPDEPEDFDGFQDTDGCPDPDNDGDGIHDRIDQCPDEPEDVDGFEDEDGCPDPDNDGDGILDVDDACPNEAAPGTPDGCPRQYDLVVVTETKIELRQTVYFDTNKATIQKRSFPLLDDVSRALADNPTIRVRIEGHTDSQGADAYNKKLSQRRADSVRKYLIGKGIRGARMVAVGFGEEVPIADNRTAEGRAQNRRVEFFITER